MNNKCIFIILFAWLAATNVAANTDVSMARTVNPPQRPLLRLKGKVAGGKLTVDKNDVKIELRLRFEITNVSTEVALIFKGDPALIDTSISGSPVDQSRESLLFRLQTLPSNGRSPTWVALQQTINQPLPSDEYIRKLAPNETWVYETTDWFYVGKRSNIDPKSKNWNEISQSKQVWLQETLLLWSADIERNADRSSLTFSKMLQKRWRPVGELQLEPLISEPIRLEWSELLEKN